MVFQKDLNLLKNWANIWGMSFNTTKCSLIAIGNNNAKEPADSRYYLSTTSTAPEKVRLQAYKTLCQLKLRRGLGPIPGLVC